MITDSSNRRFQHSDCRAGKYDIGHTHTMHRPNKTESELTTREETVADIEAITEVTVAAFKTLAVSHQTEHFIVQGLRLADALTLSLVAEIDECVVGHIAFSPMTIADGTQDWCGLGPISVLPEYQKQGIGKALIREGLDSLKKKGGQSITTQSDLNLSGSVTVYF